MPLFSSLYCIETLEHINFETQRDGWLKLEGWVAKLLARLLNTASTPGSNPFCLPKSQMRDISEEVANTF
jgi:hypothetical protein